MDGSASVAGKDWEDVPRENGMCASLFFVRWGAVVQRSGMKDAGSSKQLGTRKSDSSASES